MLFIGFRFHGSVTDITTVDIVNGAAAQPAKGTGGSPPQLLPHLLKVEEADAAELGRSQWGCPVKAAPQRDQVSWAPSQI